MLIDDKNKKSLGNCYNITQALISRLFPVDLDAPAVFVRNFHIKNNQKYWDISCFRKIFIIVNMIILNGAKVGQKVTVITIFEKIEWKLLSKGLNK